MGEEVTIQWKQWKLVISGLMVGRLERMYEPIRCGWGQVVLSRHKKGVVLKNGKCLYTTSES